MTTEINPYQGDVARLSDAEIDALICEIERECGDHDDDGWAQYQRLAIEKRRRWEAANPEEAERQRLRYEPMREAIEALIKAQSEAMKPKMAELYERAYRMNRAIRGL